ncbi:MAG: hypothetical protein OXI01_23215 [Albidovulum sp.]|nr:hypothetical protein [Albidovulum sp.]
MSNTAGKNFFLVGLSEEEPEELGSIVVKRRSTAYKASGAYAQARLISIRNLQTRLSSRFTYLLSS